MFETKPVEPIAMTPSIAFVCRTEGPSGLAEVPRASYPPSPRGKAFREARLATPYRSLGDAARAIGLSLSEVSDLETGARVFVVDDDWARAMLAIKAAPSRYREPPSGPTEAVPDAICPRCTEDRPCACDAYASGLPDVTAHGYGEPRPTCHRGCGRAVAVRGAACGPANDCPKGKGHPGWSRKKGP